MIQIEPEHPGAVAVREELVKLRKHLPEMLEAFVDDLPKELPRIASVENILHFLKLGRFDDVVPRCRNHLQRYPEDLRIRNNLAEALSLKGEPAEAIKILDETIKRVPANFYSHAARARVLYFLNRKSESEADAQELRTLRPKQVSDLTKAAQTFAFRGDDDGVAWAYQVAKVNQWLQDDSTDVALLLHYEATRLARAGDVQAAKVLWERADKIGGKSVRAAENLRDLRQPVGERNGPFYFELGDWLNASQEVRMRAIVGTARDRDDEPSALVNVLGNFLRDNRDLEHLLPDMLERGDPVAVQFAARLARLSDSDGVKAAVMAFVHGSRGTDALRHELAAGLHRDGVFDSDTVTIYVRGKQDRIEFVDFEITDEPTIPNGRGEDLCKLVEDAVEHLHDGEGAEAEKILREALSREPEAPDIKNNLAMALQLQDRMDEANRLIDEVIEQHPDYFFGQIAVANRAVQRLDYDEALETLARLHKRKRIHGTEFVALTRSMVYALVGKRDYPSAQRWLSMLHDYDPEHPAVDQLSQYIRYRRGKRNLISRLLGSRPDEWA